MRQVLVGATTMALLVFGVSKSDASMIDFEGATTGCFDTVIGCTTYETSPSMTLGGQSIGFVGSTFDLTTAADGSASFTVGTFTRPDNANFTSDFTQEFTLRVRFDLPISIVGGQFGFFEADLAGTLAGGGNSFLSFDFANGWQTFTFSNAFGQGSFEFAIPTDPQQINRTQESRLVTGSIRNAVFTELEPLPTVVPEPASLLLFASGLGAIAVRRRARRRSAERS